MEILKCNNCGRTQKEGKFCLDCGRKLERVITSEVQFKRIKSKRTADTLKRDIRNWLGRIGVQNSGIIIGPGEVEYVLGKNTYHFKSILQDSITNNLAAVEQFLHYRVLSIERGIETTEQAFKGYEALPDPTDRLREMTDSQLKSEIKRLHPDTGNGNKADWDMLMVEKERRRAD